MIALLVIPIIWIQLFLNGKQIKEEHGVSSKLLYIIGMVILTPISLAILSQTMCYLFEIPMAAIAYVDIVYIPFLITTALLIAGIKFLKGLEKFDFLNTTVLIFAVAFFTVPMAEAFASQYIYKVAQTKYHKAPEYINISLECDLRSPHSVLLYGNKEYYWSFKERAFVQGENLRRWI